MMSKSWCLSCNSLEDVIDKRVHDAHCSTGNTNIWMNLLQNSVDESSITLLSCSLSLHNFCPSLSLSSFLGAFLCRALLGALHWRRLATGTHLNKSFITIVRCSLGILGTETGVGEDCTPIYVLCSDRKFHIRKRIETSMTFDFRILWSPLFSQKIRFLRELSIRISIRIWIRNHWSALEWRTFLSTNENARIMSSFGSSSDMPWNL